MRLSRRLHVRVLVIPIAVILVLASRHKSPTIATSLADPNEVVVSNVRDTSFVVTWTSAEQATGSVRFGHDANQLTGQASDVRQQSAALDDVHYVQITGLIPKTQYYFDVYNGTQVDNNRGEHYRVQTGSTLGVTAPEGLTFGKLLMAGGGQSVSTAIVYATLVDNDGQPSSGRSATESSLVETTEDGYWDVTLSNFRANDLSAYFAYSNAGDSLEITVNAGSEGDGELTIDTAARTNDPDTGGVQTITLSRSPTTPASTTATRGTPARTPTRTPTHTPQSGATRQPTVTNFDHWVFIPNTRSR